MKGNISGRVEEETSQEGPKVAPPKQREGWVEKGGPKSGGGPLQRRPQKGAHNSEIDGRGCPPYGGKTRDVLATSESTSEKGTIRCARELNSKYGEAPAGR